MSCSLSEIVADPTLLLHRIDPARRRLVFRRTTAEAVRGAAFIDGRTNIWVGEPIELPFAGALDVEAAPTSQRAIFHMSFCGSTLLARLLDRPGKVLSLKEPNCLVDLADWRSALAASGSADSDFEPIVRFAGAMLNRPWQLDEALVIKPSSWANNLIGALAAASPMRALFVTVDRDRFLEAVLRGGRDRLAFTARLASHLSSLVEGRGGILREAIDSTEDPVGKAARLALVAHHFELRLFENALAEGFEECGQVDFAEIEADPAGAAADAADILGLPLDRSDIEANCSRWGGENAKADADYSGEKRRSENEQVRAHFGGLIEAGLDWADQALARARPQRPA